MPFDLSRYCMQLLIRSSVQSIKRCDAPYQFSAPLHKGRRIFYNKYIEQMRRKKKVYTGYAHDVLKSQEERTSSHDDDEVDYQKELIAEGKRRQGAYIHYKRTQEIQKGPGPRLLTWQQMEQVRFLRQTDPEEWDTRTLAHSFQVPELVIRKVLNSKVDPRPKIQEKQDNKARANHRLAQTSEPIDRTQSSLVANEKDVSMSQQEQWGLPEWKNLGWFSGYEKSRRSSNSIRLLNHSGIPTNAKSQVQWLDDDECEFYQELNQTIDHESEGIDTIDSEPYETEEEPPFEVHTKDGISFYDPDGELLFKI